MNSELSWLKELISTQGGPGIIRIQASAGSGKTYALTTCYLTLLGTLPISLTSLRSILAVTFTNKAAEEMKERVLLFLKKIALSGPDGEGENLSELTGLTPSRAKEWLEFILRHYGSFSIGTIDSFIFEILRGIALEHGIRPDLIVESDTNWIINLAFDELLYKAENDNNLLRLFEDCVKTFLFLQRKSGFFVEKNIKRMMSSLQEGFRHEILTGANNKPSLKDFEQAKKDFIEACKELCTQIQACGLELRIRDALRCLQSPIEHIDKAIFCKRGLSEIVKKNPSIALNNDIDVLYQKVIRRRDEYLYQEATNKVAKYTELFGLLNAEIERLRENLGIIPMGGWLDLAAKHLSHDSLAGVYAILGEKLRYILIDEFQDTSGLQWFAMQPLVENAISEGGKLIYVGDPKQSIYIWREADPNLFLKVKEMINQKEVIVPLEFNYRSRPCIVSFNNAFYWDLVNSNLDEVAEKLFGKTDESNIISTYRQEVKNLIANFYKDVKQLSPFDSERTQEKCVFEFIFDKGEKEQLLKKILQIIHELIQEGRRLQDLAILTRRNEEAEDISELLWQNGYPCITKNSLKVERCPTINGLINLLRFLDNPRDETALMRALISKLFENVDPKALINLKSEKSDVGLLKILEDEYPGILEELRELFSLKKVRSPYMITSYVVKKHGLLTRFPGHRPFLFRYLDLLMAIEEKGILAIDEVLDRVESEGERIGIGERLDAVKVLTIHDCKGLEFPIVLLAYCNWDVGRDDIVHLGDGVLAYVKKPYASKVAQVIYKKRVLSVLEALNLLYVATTRAKEALYLLVLPKRNSSIADIIQKYISSNGSDRDK